VAQAAIAAEIHQPLDVHGDLTPQVTFDDKIVVDHFADLQHFLVGQLRNPARFGKPYFFHDLLSLRRPNSMDILQRHHDALVGRYVHPGNTGHSHHSCCRPALVGRLILATLSRTKDCKR
jgi:hypothetical protein